MNPVKCPICRESEPVLKASAIYIAALEIRHGRKPAALDPDGSLGEPPPRALQDLSPAQLAALGKRLGPPSSSKRPPQRPIHPDLLVGGLTLIAPFFIYQIYTNQLQALLYAVGTLAVFYVFYLWQRKRLVGRFEALVQSRKEEMERAERGVRRWMGLYYCAADDVVFTVGGHNPVSADRMSELL